MRSISWMRRGERLGRGVAMGAVALAIVSTACTAQTGAAPAAASPTPGPSPGPVAYHGTVQGHLATPTAPGPHPAVVMIHEWWGLNEHIKTRAQDLAREGYVVLAVDLYNGRVAQTQPEAQALTQGLDQAEARANLQSAVTFLRSRQDVKRDKVASLGWCFGGGWSLRLAQAQPDLAAAVVYYGTVPTDADALKGLPPIHTSIPKAQARAFDQALTTAGVPHEIHTYPGAPHAFANPTNSERYRPDAAADAWAKTLAFLAARLK
ncbi:MAG: dienelactone hydrolase family protein [Candidatus Sericytochromatia bacterium]